MSVKIIVDSASDILPQEAAAMGIIHVPLTVLFGKEEYQDGVDLSSEAFYHKLIESDVLPVTSQVTPARFEQAIRRALEEADEALIITVSSRLSGTCQSAMLAAQGFDGRVVVVDSLNVTIGERILTMRAVTLRDEGLGAAQIAEKLNREKQRIRLLGLLDTLEYLRKGGRLSAAAAIAGSLLSIKPVVAVEGGEVVMAGKARGSRNGSNLLRELIARCGGISFDMPYYLAYSGLSDAMLNKYAADSVELWQGYTHDLPMTVVGSTIGTHVGPGAIAVAFFEKE